MSIVIGAEKGAIYTFQQGSARAVVNDSTDGDFVGLLSETPSGIVSAEVRSSLEVRVGDHGVVLHPFYYGQRTLGFQGSIGAGLGIHHGLENQRIDKLKNATGLPGPCVVSWQPMQPDGTRAPAVRFVTRLLQAPDPTGDRPKTWSLQLVPEGVLESVAVHTSSVTIATATSAGGRSYPRSEPDGYAAATGGSLAVTNQGSGDADPVITVTGPAIVPTIVIDSTRTIRFENTLDAGEVLTVDVESRTATSSSGVDWYQFADPQNEWWAIGPGAHTVEYQSAGGLAVGAALSVAWRDTWR